METVNKPSIKVGISSCLMGENVRYNAGHSQSKLCLNQLNDYFDFQSFCPEVAAGFGIPRPVMRLSGEQENPSLIFSDQREDATKDLAPTLLKASSDTLQQAKDFDGFILMKNSPSCGLFRVKVYPSQQTPNSMPNKDGRGIFAKALTQYYPNLPVEEEGRLHDPHLKENFILRVYLHHHFRSQVLEKPTLHALINFHSRHKYLLMAHNQMAYRNIGRLVAHAYKNPLDQVLEQYLSDIMQAFSQPASRKGHTNVMQHILGYLKKSVPSPARQKIADTIHEYRLGLLPLSAPLTLLQHYIDQNGSDYIKEQIYWQPYPQELKLRRSL